MKINKGKSLRDIQRDAEHAEKERLQLHEVRKAFCVDENMRILRALQRDATYSALGELWCLECTHKAKQHTIPYGSMHTAYACTDNTAGYVCGCTVPGHVVKRLAREAYDITQIKNMPLLATVVNKSVLAAVSTHHDLNKRVLAAVRRVPNGPANGEFICECGHAAKMHRDSFPGKGCYPGKGCSTIRNTASKERCSCVRSFAQAVASGMADAES